MREEMQFQSRGSGAESASYLRRVADTLEAGGDIS